LAQYFLSKANITAIRRVRKSDNNRIARACGGTICSRTDEIREEDIGTGAGLFEVKKFGDEYFTFITECKDPKVGGMVTRCPLARRGALVSMHVCPILSSPKTNFPLWGRGGQPPLE